MTEAVVVQQFQAPEGAQIMGVGILGLFDNLRQEMIGPILAQHNLRKSDIQQDGWYSLQVYFDFYHALYQQDGASANFVAIGKAIAQNVTDPERIESIEQFITEELNQTATSIINNTPDGYGYTLEQLGPNHYRITNNTGSPNDIVYGYIWESLRMLANKKRFSFRAIANYPSDELGAVFEVEW